MSFAEFAQLSGTELAAFAASRAEALRLVLRPERLEEAIENLTALQAHARAFAADV